MWKKIVIFVILGLFLAVVAYRFFMTGKKENGQTMITPTVAQDKWDPDADESIERSTHEIVFGKNGFSPKTINIEKGTVVIWRNDSGETATVHSSPHPTHTDSPILNLGELADGNSFSLLFTSPGTYKYHNHFNASQFGTIIVTE